MTTELTNQQRDRIAELERELAELVARQVGFYNVLMKSENIDGWTKELISGIWISLPDATQCLNQIKAEAGVAGLRHGIALAAETGVSLDSVIVDCWCEGYAASIAKGE